MLLPWQGGGRTNESFDDDFFTWLSWQIPVIENYPYVGIDFLRDPEILVPPSEERGEMSKFTSLFCCCFFFITRIMTHSYRIRLWIWFHFHQKGIFSGADGSTGSRGTRPDRLPKDFIRSIRISTLFMNTFSEKTFQTLRDCLVVKNTIA